MAVWKKFTGSAEQLEEICDAENGWIYRLYDGTESFPNRGALSDSYSLQHITEYMICEPNPHAGMIQRWANTGQPVYKFDEYDNGWQLTKPTWDPQTKYSFNPPKNQEKEFIEVRDYLIRNSSGQVFKFSLHKDSRPGSSSPWHIEELGGFIRWLDDDWRKIEI